MDLFQALSTANSDEILAVKQLSDQIIEKSNSTSVLFFSNKYDQAKFTSELKKQFPNNVIAISTAGEISAGGYHEHSVSGFSINQRMCEATPFLIENISDLKKDKLNALSVLVESIRLKSLKESSDLKTIGLLFVDGLSHSEEILTEILGDILGEVPLIGGSSGDGLDFKKTSLFFNGLNYTNAAILLFITTDQPFEIIKTQNFESSNRRLVITDANPESRMVSEINGVSAAQAYADLIGIDVSDLNAQVFSEFPLVLKVANKCYVRSIRSVNSDGSLNFFCAIENGVVLSIATKMDIALTTEQDLQFIRDKLNSAKFSILFECILRRLAVLNLSAENKNRIFRAYKNANAVGFHTYGEQIGSLHINQTLAGVMFG